EEVRRTQTAEPQVGIRQRRLLPALAVGDRPRLRAGAPGTDAEQAALVDPGDRSAPGADRPHGHARDGDRHPEGEVEVGGVLLLALQDEAEVAARPAHVQREDRWKPRRLGKETRAHHAARETGEQELRRPRARLVGAEVTPVRAKEVPTL